jgi:hypothetical protein
VNLLTQRGLADTQPVGRLGEMPGFCYGNEVPKLLELHIHSLLL